MAATEDRRNAPSFLARAHSEIPLVNSIASNVASVYKWLKNQNRLLEIGANTAEKCCGYAVHGVSPLTKIIQGPLDLADAVACHVLDEVERKYPIILEPTNKVVECGTTTIHRSSLGRKALTCFDKVVGVAEAVLTILPRISISPEKHMAQRNLVEKLLSFPHALLSTAGRARQTLVETLYSVPRSLLSTAGRATCERSEEIFAAEISKGSPSISSISTEGKKRKYECMNSDADDESEEDDDASLAIVENSLTLSGYDSSETDQPADISGLTDSLEYHSGSIHAYNDVDRFVDTEMDDSSPDRDSNFASPLPSCTVVKDERIDGRIVIELESTVQGNETGPEAGDDSENGK